VRPGRLALSREQAPSARTIPFAPALALESRVLRLEPAAARPTPISAACALRHDPLQAQLAGLGEYGAPSADRASLNRMLSTPWTTRESSTQVLAVEAQEIECDKPRLRRARLCAQGGKI
jgi:hypothetical protein